MICNKITYPQPTHTHTHMLSFSCYTYHCCSCVSAFSQFFFFLSIVMDFRRWNVYFFFYWLSWTNCGEKFSYYFEPYVKSLTIQGTYFFFVRLLLLSFIVYSTHKCTNNSQMGIIRYGYSINSVDSTKYGKCLCAPFHLLFFSLLPSKHFYSQIHSNQS